MAETLGDVGGQADVGRGQAMFAVDVAIVNAADVRRFRAHRYRSNRE